MLLHYCCNVVYSIKSSQFKRFFVLLKLRFLFRYIQLFKRDRKHIKNVYISNKCSFERYIHQKCSIGMIPERSCDTEDQSNDC